jgi:Ca2+-binding RTX toxin-like protein
MGARLTAAIAAFVLMAATPAGAAVPAGNLLVNPGAEAAPGAPDSAVVAPPPGWITSSVFTAVQYGAFGFPTAALSTTIGGGANFFAGGPGDAVSLGEQKIDVSAAAPEIDAGKVSVELRAHLGGSLTDGDNAKVTAALTDEPGDTTYSMLEIGPVTAADRADQTTLLPRSVAARVPAGTRRITLLVTMTRMAGGGYNDGYADNIALTLTPDPPPVDPGPPGQPAPPPGGDQPPPPAPPNPGTPPPPTPAASGTCEPRTVMRTLLGSAATDRLVGTDSADVITGFDANDCLAGRGGDDRMDGGGGDDDLHGDADDDTITGSSGNDDLDGGNGNDRLTGSSGRDTVTGGAGSDRITGGSGDDRASGGSGNDVIDGDSGADRLTGGTGNDRITAGTGRNHVVAGSGNDRIRARNRSRDTIDCGPGRDQVSADRTDRVGRDCERVSRR